MPAVQRDLLAAFSHDVSLRTTSWGSTLLRGGAFVMGLLAPVVIALQLPLGDQPADAGVLTFLWWTLAAFGPVAVVVALLLWRPRTREVGRVMLFGVSLPFVACVLTVVYAVAIGWETSPRPPPGP